MRRFWLLLLLLLLLGCLLSPLRAKAAPFGRTPAAEMAITMWEFMEWFVASRSSYAQPGQYGGPFNRWYFPYSGNTLGYNNPWWNYPQVIDGVWRASSGEFWLLRQGRFILLTGDGRRFDGGVVQEGPFLRVMLPQWSREFEYRQLQDLMVLQDAEGRVVTLRRVRRPQWSW